MKWATEKKDTNNPHQTNKPFLVLPLIENERSVSADSQLKKQTLKNKFLLPELRQIMTRHVSAGTGTWPPKTKKLQEKKKPEERERPATATLEYPELLNINLLNKIDMSLIRKEFLCITNLCKLPLDTLQVVENKPIEKPSVSVLPIKSKRLRIPEISVDNIEDGENAKSLKSNKISKLNKQKNSVTSDNVVNNNNNNAGKSAYQRNKSIGDLPTSSRSMPEPCMTCGRPDQPERFHSHPVKPIKPATKKIHKDETYRSSTNTKLITKNSVQKPLAIKYKQKNVEKTKSPIAVKNHAEVIVTVSAVKSPAKVQKVLIICCLCTKEFDSALFSQHESKCKQKHEVETKLTSGNQLENSVTKPTTPIPTEMRNRTSWKAPQTIPSSSSPSNSSSPKSVTPTSPPGPPTVECYICGRMFGTKSIGIHEPQCLKKWHVQNDQLPRSQRRPTPKRPGTDASETPPPTRPPSNTSERPLSSSKKPTLPCYICEREYGASSIYIHEPQCLKKWKIENEKLPPAQRRKEPVRPDIKWTPSGEVDFVGTFHRIWENHLAELVPCRKCGRRFFPDRIERHEEVCNNLPINLKSIKKN